MILNCLLVVINVIVVSLYLTLILSSVTINTISRLIKLNGINFVNNVNKPFRFDDDVAANINND